MIKRVYKAAALVGLILATGLPGLRAASPDYATDVNFHTRPSPNRQESNINNYIFQQEEIKLHEDSGLVKVLRTDQKALVNDFVTINIELENASPRELRALARIIARKEGGDADVLWDRAGNRQSLVVVCPPFQVPYIQQTLADLDFDWVNDSDDGSWRYYYRARHRDIRKMYDNILFLYMTPDREFAYDDSQNAMVIFDQPCIKPLVDKGFEEVDIPPNVVTLDVAVYEVQTQNDLALGFDFESWKNGPGRNLYELILWDFYGNSIEDIFPGSLPMDGERWGRYQSYNVTVTTAYLDFLLSRGKGRLLTRSQLAVKSGDVGELAAVDDLVAFNMKGSSTPSPVRTAMAPGNLGDLYEYFHSRNRVNPSLLSLLTGPDRATPQPTSQIIAALTHFVTEVVEVSPAAAARIQADLALHAADGELTLSEVRAVDVPMEVALSTFRDRTLEYAKSQRVGVLMTVMPIVGLESAQIALSLDLSEAVGYTPAGGPIIDHRYFSSVLDVRDGQGIVIGGITRNAKVESRSGLPLLSDIPYLRYLFGREVTIDREMEIIVVLTPSFQTHAMTDANPPEQIATGLLMAQEQAMPDIPWTPIGFDQYLLRRWQD